MGGGSTDRDRDRLLVDKVLVVTGAGSGIGRASVLRFLDAGARVLAVDIDPDGLARTAKLAEAGPDTLDTVVADVADADAVEAAMGTAVARFGRLDGSFNNAGVGPSMAPVADTDDADWHRLIAVNLTGCYLSTKHALRQILATAGSGSIVNMSSVAGLRAVPMQVAYAASKHGIVGITRTAAVEYGPLGVRVNALCPGVVETLAIAATGLDWNALVPTPLGRISRPAEIAEAAAWLLSDRSSYVTGQAIAVDGGMTAATSVPHT